MIRTGLATLCLFLLGCGDGVELSAPTGRGGAPELRVHLASASFAETVRIVVEGRYRFEEEGRVAEGSGFDRRLNSRSAATTGSARLVPASGTFSVGDHRYHGSLLLLPREEGIDLVVVTDLESYVPGVLSREMGTAFPAAALRAQAVASRTYAWHAVRTREPGAAWHLADDTSAQVFSGLVPDRKLLDAAADTAGLVLTFAHRPLPANFHSTCGGHTTDRRLVFQGPELPPLAGVPCAWCTESSRYRWNTAIPLAEAVEKLGLPALPLDASVVTADASGRALTVRFTGEKSVEMAGHEVRRRLGWNRLRSTMILSLEVTSSELRIEGGGWGHGVGMCQMGATGLARAGAGAADILAHYYPGATIVRLH